MFDGLQTQTPNQREQAPDCADLAKRMCYGNSKGQTNPKTFVMAVLFIKLRTNRPGERSDLLGQKMPVVVQFFPNPNNRAQCNCSFQRVCPFPVAASDDKGNRFWSS